MMNRILNRALFVLVVTSITSLATADCQAQRAGGLFSRISQNNRIGQNHFRFFHPQARPSHQAEFQHELQSSEPLHVEAARNYQNWRNSDPYNFYDVSKRYPKYYGGFHSSHFNDIGIPHGDKGFRGNGIYWTPW